MMKKIFSVLTVIFTVSLFGQTQLNNVTFGFGAGYNFLNDSPYSYSLSTDGQNRLQRQELSKGGFVISSVVTIKFAKLVIDEDNKITRLISPQKTDWSDKLSLNASLNLIELSNSEVSFNKSVDGGIGVGYFITENTQAAVFFDIITKRQLRDYVVNEYLDSPIPNGSDFYTALDESDNNLFYNKTFTGVSAKLIISIGNKKSDEGERQAYDRGFNQGVKAKLIEGTKEGTKEEIKERTKNIK